MAERPIGDSQPNLLSDSDSDGDVFEGFNARDIQPYVDIASKAPLFSSTPKAKQVRVESNDSLEFRLESNSSSSLNNETNLSPVEHLTRKWTSSSSSVEGEISSDVFISNHSMLGSVLSQSSICADN